MNQLTPLVIMRLERSDNAPSASRLQRFSGWEAQTSLSLAHGVAIQWKSHDHAILHSTSRQLESVLV